MINNNSMLPTDPATQIASDLIAVQKKLGVRLIIKDKNLNDITANIDNIGEFIHNAEFISRFKSEIYLCNPTETTWFKIAINKGKLKDIAFIATIKINWVKIINKTSYGFDSIVVGYSPGEENVKYATAAVPYSDYTPEKIAQHFTYLIGESSIDLKQIGKLLCYLLSKHIKNPSRDELEYVGSTQGWWKAPNNSILFNPPHLLREEICNLLPVGVQTRQYPLATGASVKDDITTRLLPMFSDQQPFLLLLLFRLLSWMLFFFGRKGIYTDQILVVHPNNNISADLIAAMLKNTRYDSFNAPPLGPNVKPLKSDIEAINDGILLVIDIFAADQYKKIEKGLDLIINDANNANGSDSKVNHVIAIISGYADLHIPQNKCCIIDFDDTSTEYSPIHFKNELKRFDADLVRKIECDCSNGSFNDAFNGHLSDILANIPETLPRSKVNIYAMLITSMRIYNDLFSPLFHISMEKYIEDWLCTQERDIQALDDIICSEYGKILNQKIDEGYFRLIPKEELTPFDSGTNTIIIDEKERRIYIETEVSAEIAKNEMQSINDIDSLTTALNNEGYLHINVHNSKCHRLHTIDSDGNPHTLYSHGIKYSLINNKNKDRFELIDKDMYLYKYDELPTDNFLPLIKTVDGRFAGKMFFFEKEESNLYFGTGRTGSGKSWAIVQILPMLFMMGHDVVILDVSGTYTKEKIINQNMLPKEVVEHLFSFINVGVEQDKIPVNLGSLKGCNNLSDKKKAIFNVIRAAIGYISKDIERATKKLLSAYLKNKNETVNFNDLCADFEYKGPIGNGIAELFSSVLDDINEIGFEDQTWDELFKKHNRIIVINLGNEVGESTHQLLDVLAASLFAWQMRNNKKFLSIAIDEIKDQNFSVGSPLSTIVGQGRKFHTALLSATQDFYNQGSSHHDVLKQSNIKSFCRPGKSDDRIAQKLGYINSVDAGFPKFKSGDTIMDSDFYNKEIGINEGNIIKGRVVDFVDTPFYEKFKEQYLKPNIPPNYYGNIR